MLVEFTRHILITTPEHGEGLFVAGDRTVVTLIADHGQTVDLGAHDGPYLAVPRDAFRVIENPTAYEGPPVEACGHCQKPIGEPAFWAGEVDGAQKAVCLMCWNLHGRPGTGHRYEYDSESGLFLEAAGI